MNNEEANPTENQNQSIKPTSESQGQNSVSKSETEVNPLQGSEQHHTSSIVEAHTGVSEEDKKKHHLVMIEAALFVAGRPLDLNEICSVINSRSKKRAQQLVREIIQKYASRNNALEILELKDERYVLQLKAEFTPLVKKLVNRPLLSSGPLKTLSYIAYRQPISQKRVIEVRGQHAYGHIKMLREMDLISPERSGRSMVLRTTDYFADYFGLTQDPVAMKRDLKRVFGDFATKAEFQADTSLAKDEQSQ
jgi:segregation and condensation protein B